jgi:hypothetical protein
MRGVVLINRASVTSSNFDLLIYAINNALQVDAVDPRRAKRWITDPSDPLQILKYLDNVSQCTGFRASLIITAPVPVRGHCVVGKKKNRRNPKFLAVVDGLYIDSKRGEVGFFVPRPHSWCIVLRPNVRPGRSVPAVLARKMAIDMETLGLHGFDPLYVSHPGFCVLRGSTRARDTPSAIETLRRYFPSLQTPFGVLGIECHKIPPQFEFSQVHDSATSKTGLYYHAQCVYRFVTIILPLSKNVFISFPLAGITVHLAPRELLVFSNIDSDGKPIAQACHTILSEAPYLKCYIYRH